MIHRVFVMTAIASLASSTLADVEVVEFTDKTKWEGAVGFFETIDFTGNVHGDYIGDGFADSHGVTFSNAYYWNLQNTYENDGWGFINNAFVDPGVWVEFDEPKMWIAADHPGFITFALYSDGRLIYDSNLMGASGTGNYSGIVASRSFDQVYLSKPDFFAGTVSVDDLHFGASIPVPGALGVMAVGGLLLPRRRRRNGRTP